MINHTDNKALKRKVDQDWLNVFPELAKFAQHKFYKVLGPLVIGIELVKLPSIDQYSPHFVVYSLWGNMIGKDLKSCFSGPIIVFPFKNEKGREILVAYDINHEEFITTSNNVKNQLPLSFTGNVSLSSVLQIFDMYSGIPPLSAAPNSYFQASLIKYKLELIVCLGDTGMADELLLRIKKRGWDLDHFALCNVDFTKWMQGLDYLTRNNKDLISTIKLNKQDEKLKRLKSSEIN